MLTCAILTNPYGERRGASWDAPMVEQEQRPGARRRWRLSVQARSLSAPQELQPGPMERALYVRTSVITMSHRNVQPHVSINKAAGYRTEGTMVGSTDSPSKGGRCTTISVPRVDNKNKVAVMVVVVVVMQSVNWWSGSD